jgi:hypothetical protein
MSLLSPVLVFNPRVGVDSVFAVCLAEVQHLEHMLSSMHRAQHDWQGLPGRSHMYKVLCTVYMHTTWLSAAMLTWLQD